MELSAKYSAWMTLLIFITLVVSEGNADRIFSVIDFGAIGDGRTDDSQAFLQAWKHLCEATDVNPTLSVPSPNMFLVKPLEFQGPCISKKINIGISGSIVAPQTISGWGDYSSGRWLTFMNVNGLILNGTGKIDGSGSAWWQQTNATTGDGHNNGPTALAFQGCTDLELSGLSHVNSPRNHISINGCNNVTIAGIHISAPEDSPNTDGIDISQSNYVSVDGTYMGTGDDCIAINGGSYHISITNSICGPGHGISIGSLGRNGGNETVEDVLVNNCTFNGTTNGARIKTWQGGSGYARNLRFKNLRMLAAQNPIIIDQYYCDSPQGCKNQTSAVAVSGVIFRGIRGSSASEMAINLRCSQSVGCTNVTVELVNLIPSEPTTHVTAACYNAKGVFKLNYPKVNCLLA